jgi:hypothetical protein
MKLKKTPRNVFIALLSVNVILIALHLVLQYFQLNGEVSQYFMDVARRFNMDAEVSVSTWYEQILFLVVAQAFAYIAYQAYKKKRLFKRHWAFLAGLCVYLSMDEGSELHELLIAPVQHTLGISEGLLFFAWIIPVGIALIVLGLTFSKFFFHLPKRTQALFLTGVIVFIAGAIGVETVSGAYWESQNFVIDFNYRLLNAAEEGLEIFGLTIAFYGLLDYIKRLK